MSQESKLILESSLQCFFFESLRLMNQKVLSPLSQETIFYSSLVMDNFGESSKLFIQEDNKTKEKILGIKLLESVNLSREKQKIELKDIAETSLFICGFFSDSLNRKIIDVNYYESLGKAAYQRLNHLIPDFYDVPSFYNQMARNFGEVTLLMNLVAKECSAQSDPAMPWLIIPNKAS